MTSISFQLYYKALTFTNQCVHDLISPMELSIFHVSKIFFVLLIFSSGFFSSSSSSTLLPSLIDTTIEHRNHTAISEFRIVNRKRLSPCHDLNPSIHINVSPGSNISDEETITVTVTGVMNPSENDWVAMISSSHADVSSCPLNALFYAQTGDISKLPLLCHYPVKAQFMRSDPDYLSCKKRDCSGSLSFHVINIRTDIGFVVFSGGFERPCILSRTGPINFANPKKPLYGHISSTDSTGTSMRLTWVSGDNGTQQVQYGDGKTQMSQVSTFSQKNMCSSVLPSPAKDFGWHDPGFIHSAVMTGLQPSSNFSYRYGSESVGWSDQIQFRTPPARGSDELRFLAYGDMGKAPRDNSTEHYIQLGSIPVTKAMADEVNNGNVDSIFHIGDISYATGFLVEWDYFLHLINPLASRVPYMTAIGNHERDYVDSGSLYITPDSGGECGVPYETYFPMPTPAKDKPWYSIEQGPVHFTVISTEHNWFAKSEQYEWMKKDMASVDRSKTPWLVFTGHRPMYTSTQGLLNVDINFVKVVEPLLLKHKVDLVLFGHVHNYERTCSIYKRKCLAMPTKDQQGIDTYDHSNYSAPVQAVIGMAGFELDNFTLNEHWSLSRISKFGYLRGHATKKELKLELVIADTRKVEDSFRIIKNTR